ncbi:MAG: hypothetical protein R2695_20005 [Acidimicrobiales bacterium]
MSIFVDENTKVIYQGLTGSQGSYYGRLNAEYGTQVVAGTHPTKAGTDVDGVPIFANVAEAVAAAGATASCISSPSRVQGAVMEAAEAVSSSSSPSPKGCRLTTRRTSPTI